MPSRFFRCGFFPLLLVAGCSQSADVGADGAESGVGSLDDAAAEADQAIADVVQEAQAAIDAQASDGSAADGADADASVGDGAPDVSTGDGDLADAHDGGVIGPDPNCLEVMPGHNVLDPSRINVVLLFAGFDGPNGAMDIPHLFEGLVAGTTDNAYSFDPNLAPLYAVEGLAGVEPFTSNLERFNFWYVDIPLYGEGDLCPYLVLEPGATCAGNVITTYDKEGNPVYRVLSPADVLPMSAAGAACALPNKYVNLVYQATAVMNEQTFPAPGNYATFGSYAQVILPFGATTGIDKVFANFVHELVHALGQVWDEKGNGLSPADYPAAMPGPNCFSLGPSQPLTTSQCAASDQLPWHDLIGNGCGADGVVDCPKTASYYEPNLDKYLAVRFDEWLYEVRDDLDGCGQGCMYTQGNVFRPFQGCNVMSSCDLTPEMKTGLFTRLGPINEREVCRRIGAITGGSSAYCDTLCLAGCPFGQRCVQGSCIDKALL